MKNISRGCWLAFVFVLAVPAVVCAGGLPKNACVLVEDDAGQESEAAREAEEEHEEGETDVVKEIPGVRAPRADEVGPRGGREGSSILPLPGLPLETSFDSVGWIPQGPAPARNAGSDIPAINPGDPPNPAAGAVQAIVPHPTDQNVMYIGTVNGGVWRTDNALATFPRWKPLTDDQMSLSIGGLAMDPTDGSGNTLVAGIGRRSSLAQLGGAHRGLLRTTDGGTTWTEIGTTALAGRSIYNLAVRGSIFLLAVPFTDGGGALPGLYRTTNGGTNFTNVSGAGGTNLPAGAITHLAADPTNLTRFYVHVAGVGFFRSTNSGASWNNLSAGLAAANAADLSLAVGSGGTLFAAEVSTANSRVYRSVDQGVTWTQMDSISTGQINIHNALLGDPANANLVYISGVSGGGASRIFRGNASLAAGSQWVSISSASSGGGTGPHTDSRAMAFTAGNRLIEADDGGVYELAVANTGTGGGVTGSKWRSILGNLQDAEMHSVSYDMVARTPFGGLQDNSSLKIAAGGIPQWDLFLGGDGGDAAADQLVSPTTTLRYASVQFLGNLVKATYDANNSQVSASGIPTTLVGPGTPIVRDSGGNVPFYTPLETNSVVAGRLIIGGNSVLYESTDQGATVRQVDNAGANSLAKMACGGRLNGVNAPDVLFYGSGSTIRFRTTTGGAFGNVAFPGGNVQGIVFDPENWKTAYVVGTTTVYLANDLATNGAGGLTNITNNLTGVGTFHTIEYLTLPSGNAIMVGTDLGAYIMRLSAPGVWKTLGDNLPHAPVYDSHFDPVGQILVASTLGRGGWLYDFKSTKTTTGQYGETFQAYVDGTTAVPTAGELFSNDLGGATKVSDTNLRELRLTANGAGFTRSAFRLPDLNPGKPIPAFSAKWNATLTGEFGNLADGFSFNFGPLGGLGASFTNGTYANEDGFNAGLTVSVRTFSGNQPGYYVRVNGAVVPSGYIFKASSDWGNFNTARHFFEVDWRMDTGLTLRVDGVAIFTNLPTPGFLPGAGNRFVFGARTGSSTEDVSLDNIAIFTGGVLAPIQPEAPYHFSAENGVNEGAAKAFDANANTKWLATNYTGFIGASLPFAKTIRLYTLTSANDTPGRDLASWDFQTGNDGVLWKQHGAQTAQFFANRLEQRAFVVANPEQHGKFRVLISENHEAPELQLAEFQPWEFVEVLPFFRVANNNQSGAGSLRQAISDAAPFAGQAQILFAPSVAGQTIALTSPLAINDPEGVSINGIGLTGGLTISGSNTSRIFEITNSSSLRLKDLTLAHGFSNNEGGAIFNSGKLLVENCTFTGNSATNYGGAIYSTTSSDLSTITASLFYCTISGNSAVFGSGIHNNNGRLNLTHCTISANGVPDGGAGVSSYGDNVTETAVLDSIISGNLNSDVAFVLSSTNNSFTSRGWNIIGNGNATGDFTHPNDLINTAALLAPLDNYGGPTKTMALQLGSPARNSSSGGIIVGDQRGFPIVDLADRGAYEAGTLTNYNAYIWELLPASATVGQHDIAFDFDGDGATNFAEFIALTGPADATSRFRVTNTARVGSNIEVTYTTALGRNYSFETSTNLVAWTPVAGSIAGTGNPITTPLGPVTGFSRFFVRVIVSVP